MDKALEYQLPLDSVVGVAASRGELQADVRRDVALGPVLADHVAPPLPAEKAQTLGWEKGMHLPAAPSLRVFTSVAITTTLFLGLVIGLTFAEVLGDLSGAVRGFLLVTTSLSIALMTTVSLSMIFPHRSLASGYPRWCPVLVVFSLSVRRSGGDMVGALAG